MPIRPDLLARAHHADAQFEIGKCYFYGNGGVNEDKSIAMDWYEKAAQQGYTSAQLALAAGYKEGKGRPVNHERMAYWYQEAADKGKSVVAQYEIGECFNYGRGVRQNYAEAQRYYRLAKDRNYDKFLRIQGYERHCGHHIVNRLYVRCCCASSFLSDDSPWCHERPCSGKCVPISEDCCSCSGHCCKTEYDASKCNKENCAWCLWNLICCLGPPSTIYPILSSSLNYVFKIMLIAIPSVLPITLCCMCCAGTKNCVVPLREITGATCDCCSSLICNNCKAIGSLVKNFCGGSCQLLAYCCSTEDCNPAIPYYRTYHLPIPPAAPVIVQQPLSIMPEPYISQQPSRTLAWTTVSTVNSRADFNPAASTTKANALFSSTTQSASSHPMYLPKKDYVTIPREQIACDFSESAKLGEGAFGIVYRGKWNGEPVAIKQLRSQTVAQKVEAEFHQEVEVACKLKNPHLIIMHGASTDVQPYCMILELMEVSLYQELHSKKVILWNEREQWAWEIADGLHYLHTRSPSIVHRDIKSTNIMLSKERVAKIGDFGLARVKEETNSQIYGDTQVYRSFGIAGNSRWAPPEALKVHKTGGKVSYSPYTDIYSYGMTLWEIASCKIPFEEQANEQIVMGWIMEDKRPEIPTVTPKIFSKIIQDCWAVIPKNRPEIPDILKQLASLIGDTHAGDKDI